MKTKAVRLHGKEDLRLDEFELPDIREDEILAKVMADSLCMSSHKATKLGTEHKRIPADVAERPVIIGHEFSGELVNVGNKWSSRFKPGSKFSIQPALSYKGSLDAPGYSYHYIGGDATYVVIPREVMEMNCLLEYTGEGFYPAALSEPYSCVAGTFHAHYHTTNGSYIHKMGIAEGGRMAMLAAAGPMGTAAIDYIIHCDRRPKFLVVTDIDDARLNRIGKLLPGDEAAKFGVELHYLNTKNTADPVSHLRRMTGNRGYDDVLVFAPVKALVEQAGHILGMDGCLNFFAGPSDPNFSAECNFYDAHYHRAHIVGTSGGNTDDMVESLNMTARNLLHPEVLITHIGGLNAVPETTINLPKIPGGKKLIYTHANLPLVAIEDFKSLAPGNPFYKKLHEICQDYNGLWNLEAEKYLIENAPGI